MECAWYVAHVRTLCFMCMCHLHGVLHLHSLLYVCVCVFTLCFMCMCDSHGDLHVQGMLRVCVSIGACIPSCVRTCDVHRVLVSILEKPSLACEWPRFEIIKAFLIDPSMQTLRVEAQYVE